MSWICADTQYHVKTRCSPGLTHVDHFRNKASTWNKSEQGDRKSKDPSLRQCLAVSEGINGWILGVGVLGTYRWLEKASLCWLMARRVDKRFAIDRESRQQNRQYRTPNQHLGLIREVPECNHFQSESSMWQGLLANFQRFREQL
jgi:hypothetical protein